jgi:Domain of Unknown Function (DUF928)
MTPCKLATALLMAGLILGVPFSGSGADTPQKKSDQAGDVSKKITSTSPVPVYKPPVRGAPGGRVGGGTRGIAGARAIDQTFVLSVLAPNHTGLTTQEQPDLFWYLSKSISTPMEFTLMDAQGVKPLIETSLGVPSRTGIQRVRLTDYGVRLEPGKHYEWFVALVVDPERRSKDVLAGGAIERVEQPMGQAGRQPSMSEAELARFYAEHGIWYDAIAAVSKLIEATPNDSTLRRDRAALLNQAGLQEIAEAELRP